jgi:hypothetical protein
VHQNLLIRLLDFQHLLWVGIRSLLSDPTSPQSVQGLPGVSAELGPGILGPRWIWEIWQLSTPSCRQVLLWFRICHFFGARKSEQLKGWDSLSHFELGRTLQCCQFLQLRRQQLLQDKNTHYHGPWALIRSSNNIHQYHQVI